MKKIFRFIISMALVILISASGITAFADNSEAPLPEWANSAVKLIAEYPEKSDFYSAGIALYFELIDINGDFIPEIIPVSEYVTGCYNYIRELWEYNGTEYKKVSGSDFSMRAPVLPVKDETGNTVFISGDYYEFDEDAFENLGDDYYFGFEGDFNFYINVQRCILNATAYVDNNYYINKPASDYAELLLNTSNTTLLTERTKAIAENVKSFVSTHPIDASIKYYLSDSATLLSEYASTLIEINAPSYYATFTLTKATEIVRDYIELVGKQPVKLAAISITPEAMTLNVGETKKLSCTFTPADAYNTAVSYNSSDSTVATVSATGAVTAVAPGSAVITATADDGGLTDTSTVTVKSSATAPPSLGDINGDGKIKANDARSILRFAAGLGVFTDEQKDAADINGDGKIKANDARIILRIAAGLDEIENYITSGPIELIDYFGEELYTLNEDFPDLKADDEDSSHYAFRSVGIYTDAFSAINEVLIYNNPSFSILGVTTGMTLSEASEILTAAGFRFYTGYTFLRNDNISIDLFTDENDVITTISLYNTVAYKELFWYLCNHIDALMYDFGNLLVPDDYDYQVFHIDDDSHVMTENNNIVDSIVLTGASPYSILGIETYMSIDDADYILTELYDFCYYAYSDTYRNEQFEIWFTTDDDNNIIEIQIYHSLMESIDIFSFIGSEISGVYDELYSVVSDRNDYRINYSIDCCFRTNAELIVTSVAVYGNSDFNIYGIFPGMSESEVHEILTEIGYVATSELYYTFTGDDSDYVYLSYDEDGILEWCETGYRQYITDISDYLGQSIDVALEDFPSLSNYADEPLLYDNHYCAFSTDEDGIIRKIFILNYCEYSIFGIEYAMDLNTANTILEDNGFYYIDEQVLKDKYGNKIDIVYIKDFAVTISYYR